jgi:hypothetical protein
MTAGDVYYLLHYGLTLDSIKHVGDDTENSSTSIIFPETFGFSVGLENMLTSCQNIPFS